MKIEDYYQNITGTLNIDIVVPLDKYLVFNELGEMISDTFKQLSISHNVIVESIKNINFESDKLYLLLGVDVNQNWVVREDDDQSVQSDPSSNVLPENFIIYQMEQMWRINNFCRDSKTTYYLEILNKAKAVWDYSLTNIDYYNSYKCLHVPVYFVPIGFTPWIDYSLRKEKLDHYNISTAFIGNITGRRSSILNFLKTNLKQQGHHTIHLLNNNVWNNKDPRLGEIANLKSSVFCSLKIIVNINMFDPIYCSFDLYRIVIAIANKCLVISEPSRDLVMNKFFSDYIILCNFNEMTDQIAYYQKNEEKRAEKVDQAYKWLTTKFKFSNFIPINSFKMLI